MAAVNLKRLLASDKVKVGHSIFEFNSPGVGQIIASAGCDFVFLDMEHSGFGISEIKRAIAGLLVDGIPPLSVLHQRNTTISPERWTLVLMA